MPLPRDRSPGDRVSFRDRAGASGRCVTRLGRGASHPGSAELRRMAQVDPAAPWAYANYQDSEAFTARLRSTRVSRVTAAFFAGRQSGWYPTLAAAPHAAANRFAPRKQLSEV